jgi:hypothetical protein
MMLSARWFSTKIELLETVMPDGFFQTTNPTFGQIWRALEWEMLYFMTIWNILRPFGIIYGSLV